MLYVVRESKKLFLICIIMNLWSNCSQRENKKWESMTSWTLETPKPVALSPWKDMESGQRNRSNPVNRWPYPFFQDLPCFGGLIPQILRCYGVLFGAHTEKKQPVRPHIDPYRTSFHVASMPSRCVWRKAMVSFSRSLTPQQCDSLAKLGDQSSRCNDTCNKTKRRLLHFRNQIQSGVWFHFEMISLDCWHSVVFLVAHAKCVCHWLHR